MDNTEVTQKQRHPESLSLHVSKLPIAPPRCVQLRAETRHHFQARHKAGVEAPGVGYGRSQNAAVEGSANLRFLSLVQVSSSRGCCSSRTGRQRRWCSGERVCLGCSQPGQAAQEAALTSAPGAVAPRPVAAPRARKNSRQPGGEYIGDRTQGKGSKEGQGTEKEGSSSKMGWSWG